MTDRLTTLRSQIDEADHAYYTKGHSPYEDALYDAWKEELKKLNPDDVRLHTVGATVRDTILSKKSHKIPMGSQFKAVNLEEFTYWVNQVKPADDFHASYKMDGSSFSFEYVDGRLVSAVSRGDGAIGEDITANAYLFKGLPKVCKLPSGKPFTGYIRGEVILLLDDWKIADPELLSNPRNVATGIARRKDGAQSDLITVYAFRIFDAEGTPLGTSEAEQSKLLKQLGCFPAPYVTGTAAEVWQWYLDTQVKRSSLQFWIDGIVVKVNDLKQQAGFGEVDDRPKGQIAVKFEAEGADTILRDVVLSTGFTGAIVPTAVFDPVTIGGTQVANASLCNWENIAKLEIGIGDKIRVIKAGDIIPRIMEVVETHHTEVYPAPKACPVCGGEVGSRNNTGGESGAILYCLNAGCSAKLFGKIKKFLDSLGVLGIGDNLIQSLITDMGVKDPADLYVLHERSDEMANLKLSGKVRLGEKRTQKFLEELDKRKQLTLPQFLGSLGVFGLGVRRVELIQEAANHSMDQLDNWFNGSLVKYANEFGIPNIATRLQADLLEIRSLIEKFKTNGITIIATEIKPQVKPGAFIICITGSLSKPKAYFWDKITAAGHIGSDEFSKQVTHLVAADPSGSSSKLQKARKQGIPILSEIELETLLEKQVKQ